jgi:phosphohistidine phosphatase
MDLFLIRHAVAVPAAPGQPDAARPLSPEGRERFAAAVRGMRRIGLRFDRLHHSPWLRALQTAEALMPLVEIESVACPFLTRSPGDELLAQISGERVALVGHEPFLSELLAWLVLSDRAQGPRFAVKKGGLAQLRGEPKPGAMQLLALLPPKALRAADV